MSSWAGAVIAVVVLLAATAVGVWLRRRQGRFHVPAPAAPVATDPTRPERAAAGRTPPGAEPIVRSLGVTPGTPVTLVQFSSSQCASCAATRALCADVAATTPGAVHLEIDAEAELDAVRALNIWRTPTVLVVDGAGHVRGRASGLPTRDQLLAAVAAVAPGQPVPAP
jgi:hypothetical protein